MATTTTAWWQQAPVLPYGSPTDITLATGAKDIEKGNIYAVPAGSPVFVPIGARVAWEDSQHVVLETSQGVLNFLHVNPKVPTGTVLAPNQVFATSSTARGSVTDPTSHITYTETGDIIEVGLYDSVARAKQRENFVGGKDAPTDFTGIYDPSGLLGSWPGGVPVLAGGLTSGSLLILGIIAVVLLLMLR
jgi:hypothetical protein